MFQPVLPREASLLKVVTVGYRGGKVLKCTNYVLLNDGAFNAFYTYLMRPITMPRVAFLIQTKFPLCLSFHMQPYNQTNMYFIRT